MSEIARIIHVTDMHLLVDRQGYPRPAKECAMLVRVAIWLAGQRWGMSGIQKILEGLYAHSRPALRALIATLHDLAQTNRPCPLAVVQTGDVEAYGGTEIPNQPFPLVWQFPSFDYWQTQCRNLSSKLDLIVNIYGNHDVWPRTLPVLRPWTCSSVERSIRQRSEFTGPLPDCTVLQSGKFTLEFYRLNTIQSQFLRNTFADGNISTDSGKDLSYELSAIANRLSKNNPNRNVIRLIVMHHPPHAFTSAGTQCDLHEGTLTNVNVLTSGLNSQRFHFVLAGHRHAINPKPGTGPWWWQPPLPTATVQLTAGSATQFTPAGHERPSFNVYFLFGDERQRVLSVDRAVYRFRSDLDTQFTLDGNETVINQLRL
jgi:hypothetical protein